MKDTFKRGLLSNLVISLIILVVLGIVWFVRLKTINFGSGIGAAWAQYAFVTVFVFAIPISLFISSLINLVIFRKYPKASVPNYIIFFIAVFLFIFMYAIFMKH